MTEKNRKKAEAKKQRVYFDMNMGTRSHKSAKYPSRQAKKAEVRKEVW